MKDEKPKNLNLNKQEYWETKKGAPILGRNGPLFFFELFIGLLVGIPVFCVANYLIRGEWPALAVRLVQSIH